MATPVARLRTVIRVPLGKYQVAQRPGKYAYHVASPIRFWETALFTTVFFSVVVVVGVGLFTVVVVVDVGSVVVVVSPG
jgi:hypothetical protein